MKTLRLRNHPRWYFDSRFMRSYNYIDGSAGYIRFTIGRPIIPFINRTIDYWQQTTLHAVWVYCKASKEQIDNDICYQRICNDPMNMCSSDFAEDGARTDYRIGLIIEEYSKKIPAWVKRRVDIRMEKYYEREHTKLIREEESYEISD